MHSLNYMIFIYLLTFDITYYHNHCVIQTEVTKHEYEIIVDCLTIDRADICVLCMIYCVLVLASKKEIDWVLW